MPRIYDSSYLTQRKAEKAAAQSFFTPANGSTVPWGSRPLLGNKDSSILYAVKNGAMTKYTRFDTCIEISAGCPCPVLQATVGTANPAIPGPVAGITFTVGSIIVSWQAPTSGQGPFSYVVTPYLNGQALASVTTSALSYRFTNLDELKTYTFTVCAQNAVGAGPMTNSAEFMAPPPILSSILAGTAPMVDITSCVCYVMTCGLDTVMAYIASLNLGATIASRIMYIWVASVVQAWNWVCNDSRVSGVHDNWNWTTNVAFSPLNNCDAIVWLTSIVDYITPFIVPSYTSIYTYDAATRARVQAIGNYAGWHAAWTIWYNYRLADGASSAITTMPTTSANWNNTIVVDGQTVSNIAAFPEPQQYTRLTVQGKKQNYLTYGWDSVLTTCLTPTVEQSILGSVSPAVGAARDAEIDSMMNMVGSLTDAQKVEAEFWAGSSVNTIAPPLMSVWLFKEYVRSIGATCPVIMYSLLDLAVHMFEGARVTWLIKATHMQARPIQEIRRRYAGQMIQSWNGRIDGAQWVPYQRSTFVCPPFPDFTSGHSHFTKLFALTMSKWFGNTIMKNPITYDKLSLMASFFTGSQTINYGDFVVGVGSSPIEPGIVPAAPVTLSFTVWDDMATSAGMSRLYGGIHTIAAHTGAQTVAVQVDSYINSTWNILATTATSPFVGQSFVPTATPDVGAQTIDDWIASHPEPAPVEVHVEAPVEVSAPAPVEPTPAPVEPIPAPVEPVPAPVEPVPASVEPVPAPVEPTPAPVEPVSVEAPVEPVPVEAPLTPIGNTIVPQ
jgi:hypothetical protein